MQEKTTYKTSGVDIEAGNAFVDRLKLKVPTIGGFGGMYKVPRGYEEPILVSGSDGGFVDFNFLKPSGQCLVAFEYCPIFFPGRCTDTAQLTTGE